MVEGYNIALKLQGKTVLGRTKEDFNLNAITKSSITKDDKGNATERVVGHEATFAVSGLLTVDSSESAVRMNRDAVLALALAVGDQALIPFTYECGQGSNAGRTLSGRAVITSYSESSSASDESTISLNLKTSGDLVLAAAGA